MEHMSFWGALVLALGLPLAASAAIIDVPGDQPSVQAALAAAGPGDTVLLAPGIYNEKLTFPSGGAVGNPITLTSSGGAAVTTISGASVAGADVVLIDSKSHIRISGLTIRDNTGVTDGSGIRLIGSLGDVEIRGNVIREIRGNNAMGITVYGTEAAPIEDLVIDGNEIYDCDPAPSEALTLNGNVRAFEVTGNHVHDVDNIAIDFIGGETDIQPDSGLVAREGLCRGNIVERCGSGYSGGIYVDGGRDIVVENNTVTECDLGIEVGAENSGVVASGVVVRNNVLYHNRVVGIVFGGYKSSVGRADGNVFRGNTLYKNATDATDGVGELWVQYGNGNVVENNLLWSRAAGDSGVKNSMVASYNASSGNTFGYNLYFTEDGAAAAEFSLGGSSYAGFAAWQAAGHDGGGIFADPQLVDAAARDFHLRSSSPAHDAGNPAYAAAVGEGDMDGAPRVAGAAVDIGADEVGCGDHTVDPGEQCDDGNLVDGDGCDSNCTSTGCGNRIVTVGEQCDDGNTRVGDCCDGSCGFEPLAAACDDADACTGTDGCDGAGVCVGSATPDPVCLQPLEPGGATIKLRDNGAKDALVWRWGKAPAVADFGSPDSGDGYTLCIYEDDGPSVLLDAALPAGSAWSPIAAGGYKMRNASAAPDGIVSALLKTGGEGAAKIKLKGKGPSLGLGSLALAPGSTLIVQLRNPAAGLCFGATYAEPFSTSDAGRFSDKSE